MPTRHLAQQQCEAFEKIFDKNDLQEIGEATSEQTIYELSKAKSVVFLTPQKLINTLQKTCLKISDFDLIVFDEAHHTADDHPYNKIMSAYFEENLHVSGGTLILGNLNDLISESRDGCNIDCNIVRGNITRVTSELSILSKKSVSASRLFLQKSMCLCALFIFSEINVRIFIFKYDFR